MLSGFTRSVNVEEMTFSEIMEHYQIDNSQTNDNENHVFIVDDESDKVTYNNPHFPKDLSDANYSEYINSTRDTYGLE